MVLSIRTSVAIIQELFIGHHEICYSRFHFYWPPGERKEIQVMMAVKKDLEGKIMVDNRTDLIYYLYLMLLKIHELD